MKKEQFKLKLVETLPPLKPAEVESDDAEAVIDICADTIKLGYGLQSLPEYLLRGSKFYEFYE